LFLTFHGLLFQLLGQPVENADRYQFISVEVKEKAFRFDGIWLIDGVNVISQSLIPSASSNFNIANSTDYNGDAKADILFSDRLTGQNTIWLME